MRAICSVEPGKVTAPVGVMRSTRHIHPVEDREVSRRLYQRTGQKEHCREPFENKGHKFNYPNKIHDGRDIRLGHLGPPPAQSRASFKIRPGSYNVFGVRESTASPGSVPDLEHPLL